MIKLVLTFVSGAQKSLLADYISQNFASSQNLSKFSLSKFYAQFYLILNF